MCGKSLAKDEASSAQIGASYGEGVASNGIEHYAESPGASPARLMRHVGQEGDDGEEPLTT